MILHAAHSVLMNSYRHAAVERSPVIVPALVAVDLGELLRDVVHDLRPAPRGPLERRREAGADVQAVAVG